MNKKWKLRDLAQAAHIAADMARKDPQRNPIFIEGLEVAEEVLRGNVQRLSGNQVKFSARVDGTYLMIRTDTMKT